MVVLVLVLVLFFVTEQFDKKNDNVSRNAC